MKIRWEAEHQKFEVIDPEYRLGKFQKKHILYRALPDDVRTDFDKEVSRDENLNSYDKMVAYLENLARSHRFQKSSAPKPFTGLGVVDDSAPIVPKEDVPVQPEAIPTNEIYSVSEWVQYRTTDEGRNFMSSSIAQGQSLPIEAQPALNSSLKGRKGKGNSWVSEQR